MTEASGLSAAFAEAHPLEAARVLEGLAAEDTAGFVAALAARPAAAILRHISPPYCARVFGLLEDAQVGELIRIMGPQAAAQVLQHLTATRQAQLLGRLPVGVSVAIRLLIGYPGGTCGACMDPRPLALEAETSASEALEQARRHEGELGDCMFVVNGQRRLAGVVRLADLVRAGPRVPLSSLMQPPAHTVSALASASLAAAHAGWNEFHVLPVVERETRLVGVLRRSALANALADTAAQSDPNLASGLFGAYWQTLAALTEVVIGTLPPVGPVAAHRSEDER